MRRLLREQSGFTLLELLVSTALAMAVLTPTAALIISTQKDTARALTKAQTIQLGQVGLRRMVQELDQTYELEFPTSTNHTGCNATSGVQPCNIADALVRLSGTDYEVRYDCTVASTTVTGDRACWRYLCSASASTGSSSTCTAASGTLLRKGIVIDDLVNGTTTDLVFSFCYPNTATTGSSCAAGATRATSATVTVKVPAAGTLSTGGDPATVILSDAVYMNNLDLNQ